MNIESHPREEIGAQGSNQFASTRSNAHETIYTDDNGANHRVNVQFFTLKGIGARWHTLELLASSF